MLKVSHESEYIHNYASVLNLAMTRNILTNTSATCIIPFLEAEFDYIDYYKSLPKTACFATSSTVQIVLSILKEAIYFGEYPSADEKSISHKQTNLFQSTAPTIAGHAAEIGLPAISRKINS